MFGLFDRLKRESVSGEMIRSGRRTCGQVLTSVSTRSENRAIFAWCYAHNATKELGEVTLVGETAANRSL